jgi:predicted ATP-grasp superfamily ATP-dependent carboligase
LLLVADGDVKVCFAQASHRELPRVGGASVLCESIAPPDDIVKAARRLVLEIGLEGCSFVEFRRDADGQPVLMEINPRVPGSLALAVACGIDMPTLMHRWAVGLPVPQVRDYRVGRRMHWFVGDVWSLHAAVALGGLDAPPKGQAVREFLATVARPGHVPATFTWDDPAPAWREVRAALLTPLRESLRSRAIGRWRRMLEGTFNG